MPTNDEILQWAESRLFELIVREREIRRELQSLSLERDLLQRIIAAFQEKQKGGKEN